MSTVIKSSFGGRKAQHVAFNLQDIAQQANTYLDDVRVQAARIVVEAQRQADVIRRRAEEDGKQAAINAAERVLDDKVGKRMETLLPALEKVISDLKDAQNDWLRHWEASAVKLACAIAEKVCRAELTRRPEIAVGLLCEALALSAGTSRVRIHLNPADVETMSGQVARLQQEFQSIGPAEIVADAMISGGGCRVETMHGAVDQQVEAQLARIAFELTSGNGD
jgi:flagellar biosynthesis/type III secretory pathway protein FliH